MSSLWVRGIAVCTAGAIVVACSVSASVSNAGGDADAGDGTSGGVDSGVSVSGDASTENDGSSNADAGPCSAASCANGACFPDGCHAFTTLVNGQYDFTRKIFLTATTVFFIDSVEDAGGTSSGVSSVLKTGGAEMQIGGPGGGGIDPLGDFATDGTSFFFSAITQNVMGKAVGVYACTATNCSAPTSISTSVTRSLSYQAGYLYWVEYMTGNILRCAGAGCGGTPDTVAPSAGATDGLIVTDATNAYIGFNDGTLAFVPLGVGGTLTTMGTASAKITSIAIDAANVYVADGNGSIFRCSTSGCAGTLVPITSTPKARSLATDGTTLFWLGDPDGTVWSSPVNGTTATAMFDAPQGFARTNIPATALAVDATHLYFGGQGVLSVTR